MSYAPTVHYPVPASRPSPSPIARNHSQVAQEIARLYSDQYWRLNNLYYIKDKAGRKVLFNMNEFQEDLYFNHWYLNVILKARRLGFTTFIDLLILDTCLFNPNQTCGIIAHTKPDAEAIFSEKIQFPYDNLNPLLRMMVSAKSERVNQLKFANGSEIRVGTSFRSGTLQILHVSELGKISAQYPAKSREIRTGAMEAVDKGQRVFLESTAEGHSGDFYEICMSAKKLRDSRKELGIMDYMFHFYPWWKDPDNRISVTGILFTEENLEYFKDLEKRGIFLDLEQRAWWVKKLEILQEDMYREHPSFPEEAFRAAIIGAYYGTTMTTLRQKGRITSVPHQPGFPVHTSWDLGMHGFMCIWFFQRIGMETLVIDYIQDNKEGLDYYTKLMKEKEYSYGNHYLPHDVRVKEMTSGKTRRRRLNELGVRPIIEIERPRNTEQFLDQVEETRSFLTSCWFDEGKCHSGVVCLENYRRQWDDTLATFKTTPLEDRHAHGADALRSGAVGIHLPAGVDDEQLEPEELANY